MHYLVINSHVNAIEETKMFCGKTGHKLDKKKNKMKYDTSILLLITGLVPFLVIQEKLPKIRCKSNEFNFLPLNKLK